MKNLRIGIVGTNFISDWFYEAARDASGVQVEAVYSRKLDTGEAFAKKHGIALWQICDKHIKHVYDCLNSKGTFSDKISFEILMDKFLPNFFMMEWNCDYDYPYKEIYPTVEMQTEAAKKVRELLDRK